MSVEPNEGQILLHEYDLSDVAESLPARWATASLDPLISALEANRRVILAAVESSRKLLRAYNAAAFSNHENDRPEDCPCPKCRAIVDQWAIDHQGLVADHPKASPMPSERELARS